MKKIFFTPGPSELYPTVKKHIQNCLKDDILSISHRGSQFGKIYSQTETGLKNLLSIPKDYFIFFLSSGTEAMERIIENCAEEKSFHFISGAFGDKFYEIASLLGKNPQKYAIDVNKIFLKKGFILNNFPELICFTQNETSNGWSFPLNIIYDFKNKNPSSIVAVDIVSSVPCINMDFSLIDIAFFSVQKGFGLPAGLAVLVVGPQAYEKALKLERKAKTIGSYHSFLTLRNYVKKNQTPETPNILAIYLLGKVTQDMQKIGIKKNKK